MNPEAKREEREREMRAAAAAADAKALQAELAEWMVSEEGGQAVTGHLQVILARHLDKSLTDSLGRFDLGGNIASGVQAAVAQVVQAQIDKLSENAEFQRDVQEYVHSVIASELQRSLRHDVERLVKEAVESALSRENLNKNLRDRIAESLAWAIEHQLPYDRMQESAKKVAQKAWKSISPEMEQSLAERLEAVKRGDPPQARPSVDETSGSVVGPLPRESFDAQAGLPKQRHKTPLWLKLALGGVAVIVFAILLHWALRGPVMPQQRFSPPENPPISEAPPQQPRNVDLDQILAPVFLYDARAKERVSDGDALLRCFGEAKILRDLKVSAPTHNHWGTISDYLMSCVNRVVGRQASPSGDPYVYFAQVGTVAVARTSGMRCTDSTMPPLPAGFRIDGMYGRGTEDALNESLACLGYDAYRLEPSPTPDRSGLLTAFLIQLRALLRDASN